MFFYLKQKNKIITFTFILFILLYFIIIAIQLFSLFDYGTYLPPIAFYNYNNIGLLLNTTVILYTLASFLFILFFLYITISIKNNNTNFVKNIYILPLLIAVILLFTFGGKSLFSPKQKIDSPLIAFINEFKNAREYARFYKTDFVKINNIESKFWIKNTTYQSDIEFNLIQDQPNLIILIPDGLPARLINGYRKQWKTYQNQNDPLENLTPNFDKMIESGLLIDNYYNHTAATYAGLTGMFSSSFPARGMNYIEVGNIINGKRKKPVFSTFYDILKQNNYTNFFITTDSISSHIPYIFNDILHTDYTYCPDNFKEIYQNHSKYSYLTDNDIFQGIIHLLEKQPQKTKTPFTITAYFIGTHLAYNPIHSGGIGYKDNKNEFLNAMHNFDKELGLFLDWFNQSPYKENTIIILTTDHSHYPNVEYKQLMKNNPILAHAFEPVFCDKIPFIIYNAKKLPHYFDAQNKNSLSFTPTLLHLLGLKNYRNAFMGNSIWDQTNEDTFVYVEGLANELCVHKGKIYPYNDCPDNKNAVQKMLEIRQYQQLELDNLLFDGNYTQEK